MTEPSQAEKRGGGKGEEGDSDKPTQAEVGHLKPNDRNSTRGAKQHRGSSFRKRGTGSSEKPQAGNGGTRARACIFIKIWGAVVKCMGGG